MIKLNLNSMFTSKILKKQQTNLTYGPIVSIFHRINSPLKLIFGSNLMFLINLKVNHDQTVPKRYVYIKILMKRHPILT
jgi:hypothetical protein